MTAAALHAAREKVKELEGRGQQTEYIRLCIAGWRYHIAVLERRYEVDEIALRAAVPRQSKRS